MVPRMGFLDKLLGRAKETAGDVSEKAEPMVDKAQEELWGGPPRESGLMASRPGTG